MSLKKQIDTDIKEAMKAKDQDALRTLRAIKSMILLEETKEGAEKGADLTSEQEIKLLTKAAKQRKDSAETYQKNSRNELAQNELKELEIIQKYLPKQLSEEELTDELKTIIEKVGATSPKEMGKVMGVATKELAGKADGKIISTLVRKLLS